MVVKNSLAARATDGTPLAPLFEGSTGTAGDLLGWRGHRHAWPRKSPGWPRTSKFKPFEARGGVMDGERLTRRRGRAGQQVAQPRGAVEHAGRPDPQPGREAGQPVDSRRRRAGQPDQAEAAKRAEEVAPSRSRPQSAETRAPAAARPEADADTEMTRGALAELDCTGTIQ